MKWTSVRAGTIRLSQQAIANIISTKSYVAERERKREKEAGY